jgi:magnesium-transporting ATPase (P-type)
MFANDKSIDNLEALFKEVKKYINLQGQYLKLELVEKLTILLSTLILVFVLGMLGIMALFYFSFMLVYALDSFTNSLIASYAIIGGGLLIIAFIIYKMRQTLIFQPMVNFLAKLFLYEDNEPKATDKP